MQPNLLADVFDLILDAVCVVDRHGHFVFVSSAFERIFGYRPDEVIGQSMLNLVYPEDRDHTLRTVDTIMTGELMPRFENRWMHKDGRVIHVMWSARWSEEHHARRDQTHLSLLFIDIDNFKHINDTFGHVMGDILLQKIAGRLRDCVRESDTVGRMGGDEFLVLLNNIDTVDDARIIAAKICAALDQPFAIGDNQLCITPSIGIAHYPQHGDDESLLIQHADEAMYRSKSAGGNGYTVK